MKHVLARFAIGIVFLAYLGPATPSFADTSQVTLSVSAAPVTRSRLVYVPAVGGDTLVLTTSTINELP